MGGREGLAVVDAAIDYPARKDAGANVAQEVAPVIDVQPGRQAGREGVTEGQAGQGIDFIQKWRLGTHCDQLLHRQGFCGKQINAGHAPQAVGQEMDGLGRSQDVIPDAGPDRFSPGLVEHDVASSGVGGIADGAAPIGSPLGEPPAQGPAEVVHHPLSHSPFFSPESLDQQHLRLGAEVDIQHKGGPPPFARALQLVRMGVVGGGGDPGPGHGGAVFPQIFIGVLQGLEQRLGGQHLSPCCIKRCGFNAPA